MKKIQALGAAIFMTVLIGMCMLAIGVNAALNPNSVPIVDSPPSASAASNVSDQVDPSLQQTQNLIAQYQDREKQYQAQIQQLNGLVSQYQAREKQYQSQVTQATNQAQQLQNILVELQRRGVIRIMNDGSIQISRGGGN